MDNKNKPKFQVGDIVVMGSYGVVGEVKSFKKINHSYVYELDGGEGFYLESVLSHLDEFSSNTDCEQINIDYKFLFGDLVRVPNTGSELYKVIGFRTEIWRYKDESWEDIIYELTRVRDGDWLECAEEEMELVVPEKDAEKFLKKCSSTDGKKPFYSTHKFLSKTKYATKEIVVKQLTKAKQKEKVDQLLDIYSDYLALKKQFGDEQFDKVLKLIVKKLKTVIDGV